MSDDENVETERSSKSKLGKADQKALRTAIKKFLEAVSEKGTGKEAAGQCAGVLLHVAITALRSRITETRGARGTAAPSETKKVSLIENAGGVWSTLLAISILETTTSDDKIVVENAIRSAAKNIGAKKTGDGTKIDLSDKRRSPLRTIREVVRQTCEDKPSISQMIKILESSPRAKYDNVEEYAHVFETLRALVLDYARQEATSPDGTVDPTRMKEVAKDTCTMLSRPYQESLTGDGGTFTGTSAKAVPKGMKKSQGVGFMQDKKLLTNQIAWQGRHSIYYNEMRSVESRIGDIMRTKKCKRWFEKTFQKLCKSEHYDIAMNGRSHGGGIKTVEDEIDPALIEAMEGASGAHKKGGGVREDANEKAGYEVVPSSKSTSTSGSDSNSSSSDDDSSSSETDDESDFHDSHQEATDGELRVGYRRSVIKKTLNEILVIVSYENPELSGSRRARAWTADKRKMLQDRVETISGMVQEGGDCTTSWGEITMSEMTDAMGGKWAARHPRNARFVGAMIQGICVDARRRSLMAADEMFGSGRDEYQIALQGGAGMANHHMLVAIERYEREETRRRDVGVRGAIGDHDDSSESDTSASDGGAVGPGEPTSGAGSTGESKRNDDTGRTGHQHGAVRMAVGSTAAACLCCGEVGKPCQSVVDGGGKRIIPSLLLTLCHKGHIVRTAVWTDLSGNKRTWCTGCGQFCYGRFKYEKANGPIDGLSSKGCEAAQLVKDGSTQAFTKILADLGVSEGTKVASKGWSARGTWKTSRSRYRNPAPQSPGCGADAVGENVGGEPTNTPDDNGGGDGAAVPGNRVCSITEAELDAKIAAAVSKGRKDSEAVGAGSSESIGHVKKMKKKVKSQATQFNEARSERIMKTRIAKAKEEAAAQVARLVKAAEAEHEKNLGSDSTYYSSESESEYDPNAKGVT